MLDDEVDEEFRIDGGLKDRALAFQFLTQFRRIHQIAVMGHGQVLGAVADQEGLGVADERGAGGGVADVPDGDVALELLAEMPLVEHLGHQSHALLLADLEAIPGDDAGALLPAVLLAVEPEIRHAGRLGMP